MARANSLAPWIFLSLLYFSLTATKAEILVGAGDIASCDDLSGARATAALLRRIPGTIFALGDLAYTDGSEHDFAECYSPTWGLFRSRTRPSPGNHEYHTQNAAAYFAYFGAAAGDPRAGYYSYELGTWHVVVLNSNCEEIGGCDAGSSQERWLRNDLASHPSHCTVAYWHSPLFSSGGTHGSDSAMKPIWQALYDGGATVVMNGHDHDYERFAPQDPNGNADPVRGIREFVVGTGGRNLRPFAAPLPNSEVRSREAYGVLKLTLKPGAYEWEFVAEAGKKFKDAGKEACR